MYLWSRKWQPSLVFLSGKSHGQRSLVGYNSWSHRVRHDWAHTHTCILEYIFEVNICPTNRLYLSFFFIFPVLNWCSHYGEQYEGSLKKKKLKIELTYVSAIPALGINPEKTTIPKDTCTPMIIILWFFFVFLAFLCFFDHLVPWPGIKPSLAATEEPSLSHWTTREVPVILVQVVGISVVYRILYTQTCPLPWFQKDNKKVESLAFTKFST